MPHHVHLILHLRGSNAPLPHIVNIFKGASTRLIRRLADAPDGPIWQASFHDRIIRDERQLWRTERYIRTNPRRWRG